MVLRGLTGKVGCIRPNLHLLGFPHPAFSTAHPTAIMAQSSSVKRTNKCILPLWKARPFCRQEAGYFCTVVCLTETKLVIFVLWSRDKGRLHKRGHFARQVSSVSWAKPESRNWFWDLFSFIRLKNSPHSYLSLELQMTQYFEWNETETLGILSIG